MRSLILGATGLIGSSLVAECEEHCRTHLGTWYHTPHPDHAPLDVRDAEAVADLIAEMDPEAVFLAAGVNDPGYTAAHPDECREVTVGGAANVAAAVRRFGGRLVLFSTEQVFGDSRSAHKEDETVAPAGTFGSLLAEAEEVVRAELPGRHLIVRSGCVYGRHDRPRGFAGRVLNRLAAGRPVDAATDRHVQPTYAADLAAAAGELAARGYDGTFHVVGPERTTEFAFARLLAFVNRYDADLVRPVAGDLDADTPTAAWLDRGKLRSVLGGAAVRFPADGVRAMRAMATEPAVRLRAA